MFSGHIKVLGGSHVADGPDVAKDGSKKCIGSFVSDKRFESVGDCILNINIYLSFLQDVFYCV